MARHMSGSVAHCSVTGRRSGNLVLGALNYTTVI
jgi:hypothetical protein